MRVPEAARDGFLVQNKLNFLVQNLCDILFGQVHRGQRFSEKRDDLFLSVTGTGGRGLATN